MKRREADLINRYVLLLRQTGINVSQVILFGSYAKGLAKPDSDIDLAIVSSQFGKNAWKEMILLRKLALKIDSHIEPLPLAPQDVDDQYSSLSQEIKRTGILMKI